MTASNRNEELRTDVLAFLAVRQSTSHRADTIRRRLNQDGQANYSAVEILSALHFLIDLRFARFEYAPFGNTIHYQATTQGVLHHERTS